MNRETPYKQSPPHIDIINMLCAFFFNAFIPRVKKKIFTKTVTNANGIITDPMYPESGLSVVFVEFII
jgi:hypothetical protein